MFAYVRLKSLMFAFFEKKYFFPVLWLSPGEPQWPGAWDEREFLIGCEHGFAAVSDVSAELSGENCSFLRIFPRFSTILRTDQGRIYAILRIFTGGTNF